MAFPKTICLLFLLALLRTVHAEPVEGFVTALDPLTLRLADGEVRSYPGERAQNAPRLARDQLVKFDYAAVEGKDGIRTPVIADLRITGGILHGEIVEIASDDSWLIVRPHAGGRVLDHTLPLQTGARFQALVKAMQAGDGITAAYTGPEGNDQRYTVSRLQWRRSEVGSASRWASLLLAALALLTVAALLTKGRPSSLYLGADNRYSTSKFQVLLWFWMVLSAYLALSFQRVSVAGAAYVGGIDIPANLLLLSGISALSFAAAKLITSSKVEQGGDAAKPRAAEPAAGDLIQDDAARTDLGDFQMLVITALAVLVYAVTVVEFMRYIEWRRFVTLPDIDATLLTLFGLGQGAYLGKKAATDDGAAGKAFSGGVADAEAAAGKAETAAQRAAAAEAEARRAADAARAATTEAAAAPETARARAAADAAADAGKQAASAAQTAEARAGEAAKLADSLAGDAGMAVNIKPGLATAQAAVAKARNAAADADKAARSAADLAAAARAQAAQKSQA